MPVIASSGSAQNGFSRFVWASPTAYAIVAFPAGTPRSFAAWSTEGPTTIHSPPPEGTKRLIIAPVSQATIGNVAGLATATS